VREGDPLREDLVEIRKEGERAAPLTRQLLAFSRKQLLKPEVINLNRVIGGMETMLRRLIGEDVDLAVKLAEDLGNVKTDPGQIEQVVMNLAVNARDAMKMGGKLTIELSNAELDEAYAEHHASVTPGAYVMISVTDGGCGMDENTKARIFAIGGSVPSAGRRRPEKCFAVREARPPGLRQVAEAGDHQGFSR